MLSELITIPEFMYTMCTMGGLLFICVGILIVLAVKNSNKKVLNNELLRQIDELHRQNKQLEEINSVISTDNTRLKTECENQKRFMEEKINYIEQNKNEMTVKFRDISNEILRMQSTQINEAQKSNLSALLTPFREQLQSFKEEVSKANTENMKNKLSFDHQFKDLLQLNQSLSSDAQNLTNALRGSKKMQGDWGEVELNRLLEISGMQKNIDFFTQENFKDENNQNQRPDVVVRLPNNRGVIIDSKVSMNDYVDYVNSENENEKSQHLQKHIQCIKAHINELHDKEYQKLLKENSLDYVIIFIPIESAFAAAIKEDTTLYDYAYSRNIALTTPSSLLPILRTVENLWKIENSNKYVRKIAEVGGNLYKKLVNFTKDMEKINKSLDNAKDSYQDAIAKLSRGKGNALSLASQLKTYGAKIGKEEIGIEFDDGENELLQLNDNSEEKAS